MYRSKPIWMNNTARLPNISSIVSIYTIGVGSVTWNFRVFSTLSSDWRRLSDA